MKFWLKRALDLKDDERAFHDGLHPDVARVLHGKHILLWQQMLESIGYEDMGVVKEFATGTPLVGESEVTGLWPRKFKPASMTAADLGTIAAAQRPLLTFQSFEFMDHDVLEPVWLQTQEEAAAGEIEGPFRLEQVPSSYPLSRRFGIKQSSKIRCVDDFTQSSINACAQTCESPKPRTVDILCSMCLGLMGVSDGDTAWQARSFDLKRAYGQCAIHPDHAHHSFIAVADPNTRQVKCFKMRTLPFGSVMSVHSFLRVAHSLWAILVSIFQVYISNYFDDFVAIAASVETQTVTAAVGMAFKTLGWIFAETGEAPPFSSLAAALGVTLDVSLLSSGTVTVDNTPNRKLEISAAIQPVLDTGVLMRHEALKLRGRRQFVAGQIFGRMARRCLAIVRQHAYGDNGPNISNDARLALHLFHQLINMDAPRTLSLTQCATWFLFTDASYEPQQESSVAGLGAVLVDQLGRRCSFFSIFLDVELLQKLKTTNKKTIIFECELLAIFVAM